MKRNRFGWMVIGLAAAIAVAATALAGGGIRVVDEDVDGIGGVDGLANGYGVAASSDGKHVYAISSSQDSVATFKRKRNGDLRFVEIDQDGIGSVDNMGGPAAVGVSGNGRQVYVAADEGALVTFKRTPRTGRLHYQRALVDGVGGVEGLLGNCCQLALSRDGRNVYVAGDSQDAVVIAKRNRRTGRLSFVDALFDGQNGVDGIEGAIGVVVSRDGDNVYVAGGSEDAVATFKRKGKNGRLGLVNVKRDGVGGFEGLADACCSLALSRDNMLFVPGEGDQALAVLKRAPRSGKLRFVRAYTVAQDGFELMDDPIDVVASGDGKRVFVASYDNSVVLALKRKSRGRLSPLGGIQDGDPGADNFGGVWRLARSPDDDYLYASAYNHGALETIKRRR